MTTRCAIVHDFFSAPGGAEACAIEFAAMFPDAPVFTSFFDAASFGAVLDRDRVRTWPFQRIPGAGRHFRAFLPAYPVWFERLDLRGFDLVVSSSVAFSKAVRTSRHGLHVSYVHTPMRYAWDLDRYLDGSSLPAVARGASRAIRSRLQAWDVATARRPDVLVANSSEVGRRIERYWKRDSRVIHPPVPVAAAAVSRADDGYWFVAARMLSYRRLDLAIEACNRLGAPLVIAGTGPEEPRLRRLAGPTITFVGRVPRPELLELYRRSHGYLVPGVEDFGIAPVEAMAFGKPVVAAAAGGTLDTVADGTTGVLFAEQTPAALASAMERADSLSFDPDAIHRHAMRFDVAVFRSRWRALLAELGVGDAFAPDAAAPSRGIAA